ncbi:MAG: hypothetical protein V4568_05500 [Pseudomonadota bacterium]
MLLVVAAINIFIDPFSIFGTPRIQGWSEIKPSAWGRPGFHKTFAVQDLKPDALILGTSRAEVGLNPKHPAFAGLRAYNLAISGGNMEQIGGYFAHARAVTKPRLVVLGLDLHSFNVRFPGRSDFDPNMFTEDPYWEPLLEPLKKLGVAINGQTLEQSLSTIDDQYRPADHRWMPEGQGWVNPIAMDARVREYGGQRNMCLIDEALVTRTEYVPPPTYEFNFGLHLKNSPLEHFRRILREAYAREMALHIFISPVHARHLEVLHSLGLLQTYEDWERLLVKTVAEEAKRAGKEPFPLWDFSGYNSVTTETVPAKNDSQSRMRGYWESSHYRGETGDLVLNRIFGLKTESKNEATDFGVLLNPVNIESHLADFRAGRQRYAKQHAGDVAEVAVEISKIYKNKNHLKNSQLPHKE